MNKQARLDKIIKEITELKQSSLYSYRVDNKYKPVIGEGNLDSQIIFIGEAPGKKEAETGIPFCGASGNVLNQLLSSISLKREDIYITNIVKDRPQNNRDPLPKEIELYAPFLKKQIEIIQPKIIATLGRFSMEYIMKEFGLEHKINPISKIHGKTFQINTVWGDIHIMPLYHPAVAIYNRKKLPELTKDFKKIKKLL